jgi:hypothetical protein
MGKWGAYNMIICPKCKSKNVVKILYGMPSYEAMQAYESKEVILGGCFVTDNDPDYGCLCCNHRWSVKDFGMEDIVKLRIWVKENGPCLYSEMRRTVYNVFRDGKVVRYDYIGPSRKALNKIENMISSETVTEVCNKLINHMHSDIIEETHPVCDGSSYEVQIKYIDGRKSVVLGDIGDGGVAEVVKLVVRNSISF